MTNLVACQETDISSKIMQEEIRSWQKQPDLGAIVWQHNRLAEARYELTAREQKLLLYVALEQQRKRKPR